MDGTQEDNRLNINTRNHLSLHLPTLVLLVTSIMILYYLKFDKYMVEIFLIIWSIDLIPALCLHFEYWVKNRGEEYEIRDHGIIRRKRDEEVYYKSEDIERIVVYLSPSLYKNSNFHLLAIESYHYAVVRLKTGEELILTCLLAPRIDRRLKQIRGVLFERRKKLFCMIP